MDVGISVITVASAIGASRAAIRAVRIYVPIPVRVLVAHALQIAVLVMSICIAYFPRAWKAGAITVIAVIARS
jgi:hypothetical protein